MARRVTWVAGAVLGCSALMLAACTAINPTFGADATGGESDASESTSPPSSSEGSSGPTASDSISSTTLPSSTTGPESSTSAGTESSTGSDEGGFLEATTGCGSEFPDGVLAHCSTTDPCSTWEQDCPDGEACRAWANDGGSAWNSTRCSPIEDDPGQAGDPCWAMGSGTSGFDSCDVGLMCWDVDSESLEGVCIEYCDGTPDAPMCEVKDQVCSITNDGVLALCLPSCDPLLGNCAGGTVCFPSSGDQFVCIPQSGTPCQAGSVEVPPDLVEDCVGGEPCCTPYCDLSDTMPCEGPLECVALFDDPQPVNSDVGVCITAM